MARPTDVRPVASTLYFLPVATRMPLKFGSEVTTEVTCARVRLTVSDAQGRTAEGWGETPLSVHWVWPGSLTYEHRHNALKEISLRLAEAWANFDRTGHPIEIGHAFQEQVLPGLLNAINAEQPSGTEPMPWLAALVACSAFDLALHDAYGNLLGLPTYATYDSRFLSEHLARFLEPAEGSGVSFEGRYPADFLVLPGLTSLHAWHLVGGKDPIEPEELTGLEPVDGHPVLLRDWIRQDGLTCLKVKLRGDDHPWDYERLATVGRIAIEEGVEWLTADFNCTVTDPAYVVEILDRLQKERPRAYEMLLYVEQPFPYDLEAHPIDVRSVSKRKPLFLDESAHDWRMIRLGRELGWTGVALKTCKTQTGALLSLAWARAHGMALMVQDLTNPMLAQVPHVLLASHAGTIMGVETNAMQFYPEASNSEAKIHPGLYQRRNGRVDLSTLRGTGFGHRQDEVNRTLPEHSAKFPA
jgi:L-alanine-DL-glutamate epimerase-like enolase superfamily enzyme